MEDTIEICSGCGKMPRAIDLVSGSFVCSRCGSRTTMHVTADSYEKVVTELDQKFHEKMLKQKAEAVAKEPIGLAKKTKKAPKKAQKKAKKAKATARKKKK